MAGGRRARRKRTRAGSRAEGPFSLAPPPLGLGTLEAVASRPENNGARRARWLGRVLGGGAAGAGAAEGRRRQRRPGG